MGRRGRAGAGRASKEGPRGRRDSGGGRRDAEAEAGAGRSQPGVRRGGEVPSSWALHPDLGLQAFGPVRQYVSAVGSSGLWGSVFVTLCYGGKHTPHPTDVQ